LGNSEISDANHVIAANEHILGLDVAVQDSGTMNCAETIQDLTSDVTCIFRWQRTALSSG
jgi:hypothetical protein